MVKAIKKTILDYLSKGHKVYTDRRDPELSTRKDRLSYFKQKLNISVKGKIDREKFGEDMCKLIGKDGACKIYPTSSLKNTWNAVMVYKGSGSSGSANTGRMMMSLKF
jgi:hypothetical protein